MIESMTGYAIGEIEINNKKLNIEIKSYNAGKNGDINIKVSNNLRQYDNKIKTLIQQKLNKGNIEFNVSFSMQENDTVINLEEAIAYYKQLKNLATLLNIELNGTDIFPLILRNIDPVKGLLELTDKDLEILLNRSNEILNELIKFRKQEGEILLKDILFRISIIKKLKTQIYELAPSRLENIKESLRKKLTQLKLTEGFNKDRFEQELIYYLEKIDITEEIVRFDSHCDFFINLVSQKIEKNLKGKKLGFITQEILREVNTIGSKAQHSEMQQLVVHIKDEIEKIKEQLNNIL